MFLFRSCLSFQLFVLSAIEWTHVTAFNLDTENVISRRGEPNSLFGFSLAMHRQLHPADKRILLVGAPRAKALPNQKAKITGGLYSCEFSPLSSGCNRLILDNEALEDDYKENQWLGVTVQSQGPGGKIVTCAHRYQKQVMGNTPSEYRVITGRCYMLSEDLTIDPNADEDGGDWRFCDGRPRGHEMFGSCQQGLSTTFTNDYHYVVFGAPGAYNWKGIVRVEQKNSSLINKGIFDDGPYEVGGENNKDPDLVPVPPDSYLGFSLDSGYNITQRNQLTIVAGAPRAGHSGAVVFLKIEGTNMLTEEFKLHGSGLASSFGYDVAVVDLNGDGWKDIVVGAPQFFMKDGEVGGAVYVYVNQKGKWDGVRPVQLNGTRDSMFGLAVENIGDVNLDSYEDLAVGAPYDDGGAGRVYMYHGAASGINTKPVQILEGKTHNIKLFGYSLAGKMDLDKNSYPDLAVGSLSDAIFVYRARPVISIEKTIRTTPQQIDLAKKTCGDSICFSIEACFSYTANPKTFNPRLTVAYTLETEAERRKLGLPSRVIFPKTSSADQDFKSTGRLELSGQNKRECFTAELQLQDNIKDKLRGIPIEVSVSIQNSRRRKRQAALAQLTPVLNANQPTKAFSELMFINEGCGLDNICQSNLELEYRFCYQEPNTDMFSSLPMRNGVPEISLNDQKDIALEVTVKNQNGDDAYEAKLQAMFLNSLSYSAFRSHKTTDKPVTCAANQNGSQADCELGNPFKRGSEVTFYIILSTAAISLNSSEIEIDLLLQTTSEQKDLRVKAKAKVVIELLLSVSGVAKPSQVYVGGEVKGESAMKSANEIGSLIEYEFRVTNLGKPLKNFGMASLTIQWPKESRVGKWILYLVKISTSGLEKVSCSPEREINPNKLIETTTNRRKRETETQKGSPDSKFSPFKDERKYKTLMCGTEAKCVEIKCPLQGLDSNAVILLRSYLWNSTFLEDYAKLNYLNIIVKASLSLDGSAKNMVLKNAETEVRVTVFPEKTSAQYGGMPWWIILVAILAGILMLALLGLLLWKCGFFKKAQKAQYDASYHKAENSDKDALTADA